MSYNNFRVLFIYPNLQMSALIPYSIGILTAVLKNEGFITDVFDATRYKNNTNDPNIDKVKTGMVKPFDYSERGIVLQEFDMFEALKEKVENFQPNLIAITSVESTYSMAIDLLKSIGKYNIPCIFGGVFATFAASEVISNDEVTYVCRGEGEGALLELCKKMANKKDCKNINNLWVKKNNKIYKNPLRPPVDLNSLPLPNYDDFDDMAFFRPMTGSIYRMLGVETERGCPFTCTYCNSPRNSELYKKNGFNFYRRKDISKIIEEMLFLKNKYKAEFFYILTDSFTAMSENKMTEFSEMYQDVNLPFWMNTRPETITPQKMMLLEKMKLHRMGMGVEHGNENYRKKVLKRKVSNKTLIDAFKLASDSNCSVTANNMIGFPDETRELVFDSIHFNRQLPGKVESTGAFIFTPFRGTPLRDIAVKLGHLDPNTIANMNYTAGSVLKLPGLSQEELMGLTRVFSFYVKFPENMFENIKIAEKFDTEGEKMYAKILKQYQKEYL